MPSTSKKPVRKTASKAAVKRAPAKATHKTTVRTTKAKKPEMRSFRASRQQEPFFTFRISHQTLYWLILAIIVVGLGVWVTVISIKVQNIYDQIDATNSEIMSMPTVPSKTQTPAATTAQ